ncbi:MAG TPA: hypothetical protein VGQ21_17135 [Thermoanaerobaculia bacterium]|nr:hypothetical protein [Thermoanaerobaculia bacterium]
MNHRGTEDTKKSVWRRATYAVVVIWIAAMARLFIADVWDESSALVVFGDPHQSAMQLVSMVLKTPMPFWRPVPTIIIALAIHFVPANAAWPLLRIVNMLMILTAVALLTRAVTIQAGRDDRRDFFFVFATLFSAGAIITGGWFANIFDASVLLLAACGLLLLARGWFLKAGFVFGIAFFFKENAAMIFPLLLLLVAIDRLKLRDAVRTALPAMVIGTVYFALRGLVVPFGSGADTHQFRMDMVIPTAAGLLESYWRETLWGRPGVVGYAVFALSLIAMRGYRARAAFAVYIAFAIVIYLSMFTVYQGHELARYVMAVPHLTFLPRLYFVPVTLTLFVFALDRRWWVIAILAIPLLAGAAGTYSRYQRFQRNYRDVYRYAQHEPKPVRIDYAMKPLHDPRRGIDIGDFPDAALRLDPRTGRIVRR